MDVTNDKILRVLQDIIKLACKLRIQVVTWASSSQGYQDRRRCFHRCTNQKRFQIAQIDKESRQRRLLGVAREMRSLERLARPGAHPHSSTILDCGFKRRRLARLHRRNSRLHQEEMEGRFNRPRCDNGFRAFRHGSTCRQQTIR